MGTALKLDDLGSPEVALLLAASRGDASRESVKRLMSSRIDWAELTRLAVENHATPGLWEVVSRFPNLPDEAELLQSLAVLNDFRRYHIRGLVARTVKELRASGIEVLALKGAALLAGGVARPALRTMSDIDLLVTKGSPEAAWRICRSSGWTMVDEAWSEALYRAHHHLPPLVDPDGISVGLELHRTLLAGIDRLEIDVPAMISRARNVKVNGTDVLVPSVEDLLLHACLHFGWSNKLVRAPWRTYADVHAIIADPAFSWERFLALPNSRRARQCCYWALRLGGAVADVCVPDDVLRRLDPDDGGRLSGLLERHFAIQIADPSAEASIAYRARRWLWFAAMRERSTSAEADQLWNEGAVEVPGEGSPGPRSSRGALRAAISTWRHVAKMVSRG